ncbi:MAG: TlpA disulfide reductase family protein [Actinomycetota bacterium]
MTRVGAVLVAVIAIITAACSTSDQSAAADHRAVVETLAGGEVDLDELTSEDVLLWFWSPSCQHCRNAIPELADIHYEFGDEVQFVGVVAPHDRCAAKEMVEAEGLDGFDHVVDPGYELADAFAVMALPTYVAIGSGGCVHRSVGAPATAELGDTLDDLRG